MKGKTSAIRIILPFIVFFCACEWTMSAQNMRRITTQDGLSGSAVTSIGQSDDGWIWIGTLDGIDVLFGGNVRRPSTGKFFEGEIVERLIATSPLDMWIQTTRTLYKINRLAETEEKLEVYGQFSGLQSVRPVSSDRVAVLDANKCLHLYYPKKKCFEELKCPLVDGEEVVDFGGTEDFFWVMGKNGLYRYSWIETGPDLILLGGTVELMDVPVKYTAPADDPDILHVLDYENRLYRLDIRQNTKTFILQLNDEVNFRGQPSGIVEIGGTYYISFKVSGAVKCTFNPAVNSWTQNSMDIKSGVFQMMKDKFQNLVWIATDGQGLLSIWDGFHSFQSYCFNDFGYEFGKPVRTFFLDEDDWLWIGMKGDGLVGIDRSDSRKDIYKCARRHLTSSNSPLKDNSVYALSASSHGGFWVGTDAGLNFFSYSDRSLRPVAGGDEIAYVHSILEVDNSKLWVSTVGAGVFEARIVRDGSVVRLEDVRQYVVEDGDMMMNYFFALHCDSDGVMWLGNRGSGIYRIGADGLEHVNLPFVEKSNLMKDVFTLQEYNDVMWVGTSGGLVGMGDDDYYIGTCEGLPNNIIRALQVDDANNMWIATNNGLARLDSTFTRMDVYGPNNGLLVTEFCDGAAFHAKGKLYFGGMNGWVEVSRNPGYQPQENQMPPLFFVHLKSPKNNIVLLDAAYYMAKSMDNTPYVELEQDENSFFIQYTAMDNVTPNDYRYLYKLEADEGGQWVDNGSMNTISFSSLQHGRYTLYLKYISLTTGRESDPVCMRIYIKPYWWQTMAMKILCWILLVAGIVCGIMLMYRREKLKHINNLKELEQQHKEDVYEEKLRFFTNITHEFCTPLTLIYSPCERILAHDGTDEFVRKYVKLIKKNANRLNELIQEVIDYRRIETKHQQLHLQRCNLSDYMKEICELFMDLAEKKGINFVPDIQPDVYWNMDMRFIPNVTSNLLSNAVKYTPQGGTMKVSFSKLSEERIEIRVYNTGKGIREEDRQRIFNRYYIIDNIEERSAAGLARNGLGMAICYSSVKLLGGTIEINSEVDKYAEFVVTLPLLPLTDENGAVVRDVIPLSLQNVELSEHCKVPLDTEDVSASERTVHGQNRDLPGILVVDDNVDILSMLNEILSRSYHVEVARSVDEALECLRSSIPELIIADVMMPDKDGMHLIRQVKQNKHTMHIPFVILSARNTVDDMTEGVQIGADAYIGKPFNVQYLLAMVERMIESRKDMQQYYNSSACAFSYVQGKLLKNEDKEFLYKLDSFVEAHLSDSTLDAEAIADAMNLSVRSLYRKLKELDQPSPNGYIKERRMEKVVKLLKTSDLSIQEIIFDCGFNNRAHFYKDFGQRYGMTPKEFRKIQKSSEDTLSEE